MQLNRWLLTIALGFVLSGCTTNPVTQKNELRLVSTQDEISLGQKHYLQAQQASGGEYTSDPELSAYVKEVGMRLARVSDRKDLPYDFVVLNDSVPNAWALPGGKIAINRGLLVHLKDEAELAAVLAHEITHAAARHGALAMERGMIFSATAKAATALLDGGAHPALTNTANALISNKYSRDAELEADAYGMVYMERAGYNPGAAVRLQELFMELSNKRDSNWLVGLFATHPPSKERLEANRLRAQSMKQNLKNYPKRYQDRIHRLKHTQEAYKKHESALNSMKRKRFIDAISHAYKAIKIEPRDGTFYSLIGDAYVEQMRAPDALEAYDKAISLNENYFYPHLQKGLLLNKLGRKNEARISLNKSNELLPTQEATHTLATIKGAARHSHANI